ncbi:MAG: CBS domain-containing protein [Thermoplasmatales archaeon]|nr:CBS domain-containing protein [Candidatus Thermoplasmatota archaeon]MCG2826235.1 CBS domain-containing protein [Thermoplasmatales archaeon]
MRVKDVMIKDVITLKPEDTVRQASKKFAENNISGAPVINNEKNVVGILSEADILKMLEARYTRGDVVFLPTPFDLIEIPFMEAVREAEVYKGTKDMVKDIGNALVSDVMKRHAVTIKSDRSIEDAAGLMVSKKVNRLPVVENNELVGIITRGDIIKALTVKNSSTN